MAHYHNISGLFIENLSSLLVYLHPLCAKDRSMAEADKAVCCFKVGKCIRQYNLARTRYELVAGRNVDRVIAAYYRKQQEFARQSISTIDMTSER